MLNGPAFAPNGIVTHETCPVCQEPDVRVEHGRQIIYHDGVRYDAGPQHLWHCPECGNSLVIVGYDCPHCAPARNEDQANTVEQPAVEPFEYHEPPPSLTPDNLGAGWPYDKSALEGDSHAAS